MEAKLEILNSGFKVSSYNGSSQDGNDHYKVDNVLNPNPGIFHCSSQGSNFDLVLEYGSSDEEKFTLTHLVVRGPERCTAPVAEGLLWVSDSKPKVEEYAPKYNDFTKESFEKMEKKGTQDEPALFFTTNSKTLEGAIELPKWLSGKFVHIKFLKRHELGGDNIDIDFVGLVGYKGTGHTQVSLGPVPEEFGITKPTLKAFSKLARDFVPFMKEKPSLIIFSDDNLEKEAVKKVAESGKYNNLLFFFGESTNPFTDAIKNFLGLPATIAIIDINTSKKWIYKNSVTSENVDKFCSDFTEGKISNVLKSAKRPEKDADPSHPGLAIVVADSFQELVLDPTKDVLLDVYADWCGPCVAVSPTIAKLAEVLQSIPSVRIAKINCDENDLDRKYLPETSIPNIKLFPKGNKENPIKYQGVRTLGDFLKFIHDNASEKFNLEVTGYSILVAAEKLQEAKEQAEEFSQKNSKKIQKFGNDMSPNDRQSLQKLLQELDELVQKAEVTEAEISNKKNEISTSEAMKSLKQAEDNFEKKELKNVKKMHSDDEYSSLVNETKDKLIVVDFFATWCGPCKAIAPAFADLSEKHLDVQFLKVDVDELDKTSSDAGVRAMPTFHFIKNGKKVEEVVGANISKITELIEKLK